MLYSPGTGGFYLLKVHKVVPSDVVEITAERHAELIAQHKEGKRIVAGDGGFPVAADPVELTEDQIVARERSWRDGALNAVAWMRDRHRDQLDIGGDTSLTPQQFQDLLVYMHSLRDWPQSSLFPSEEHRPSQLDWMTELRS